MDSSPYGDIGDNGDIPRRVEVGEEVTGVELGELAELFRYLLFFLQQQEPGEMTTSSGEELRD